MKENPEWWDDVRNKISKGVKRVWDEQPEKFVRFRCDWTGRHHTEEAKEKMRKKNSIILRGERNGSFAKVWIYNESLHQNKMVKRELVDDFLSQGWKLGRKMTF